MRSERNTNSVSPNIGFDHDPAELVQLRLRAPSQFLLRARRVSDQLVDLGRTEVCRVDLHADLAGLGAKSLFVRAGAAPVEIDPHGGECQLGERGFCTKTGK